MKYSAERIRELARVARISLSDDEVEELRGGLGALHAFAEILEKFPPVDASAEDPLADPVSLSALRADVCGECLLKEELPAIELVAEGYFRVPRAVEESV